MAHGPLPYAGGYAEQPAIIMAAFEHLGSVEARIRESEPGRRKKTKGRVN